MTSEPYEYIDPLTGQHIVVHPSETTNYVADGERRGETGMSETAKQPITEADINTAIKKLCADHERELADKDAEIARLKSAYAEANQGWKSCIDDLRQSAQICAAVEAENASLKAQVERLSAPVSEQDYHFNDEEVEEAIVGSEYLVDRVYHCLHNMTTGEKWSLYRAIATLIASRAAKEKE